MFRNYVQLIYIRECYPIQDVGLFPAEKSLIEFNNPNIEITSIGLNDNGIMLRLNERGGVETKFRLTMKEKQQM